MFYPGWEQLHKFIYEEIHLIDGIKDVQIHIINETFKHYDRFFPKETFQTDLSALTQTDWALIKALVVDGRASPGKLAGKLGVHKSTVYRRIEVLSKSGFFKIRAVPNPFKLSPSANSYIIIEAGSADLGHACEVLQHYDEIHFVLTTNFKVKKTFILTGDPAATAFCVTDGPINRRYLHYFFPPLIQASKRGPDSGSYSL